MSKVTKSRLDILKSELDIIRSLNCISFDARDKAVAYYKHEISCIEQYDASNPTDEYTVVTKEIYTA